MDRKQMETLTLAGELLLSSANGHSNTQQQLEEVERALRLLRDGGSSDDAQGILSGVLCNARLWNVVPDVLQVAIEGNEVLIRIKTQPRWTE